MDSSTSTTTNPSLLGAVVRSAIPRGRIKRIERDPGHDWDRVVVVTAQDIPGRTTAAASRLAPDVLAQRDVHYSGEPVLLVAAESRSALAAAVAAIEVEYQTWMPVVDLEESIEAKTRIRVPSNVIHEEIRGDEHRLRDDGSVVESLLVIEAREQPIGTATGARADWRDDGTLVVALAASDLEGAAHAVAAVLGRPREEIVVESAAGSMFAPCPERELELACHAALLAQAAGRPVALLGDGDRELASAARMPGEATVRTALDADGMIDELFLDLVLDGGAYAPTAAEILTAARENVAAVYAPGRIAFRGRVMATNTRPGSPAQGAGAPQATLAVERHVDRVARRLAIPAHEYRLRLLGRGDAAELRERVVVHALAETDYASKRERREAVAGTTRRGIGLAVAGHRGMTTAAGFACAVVEVRVDIVTYEVTVSGLAVFRDRPASTCSHTVSVIERAAARALGFGVAQEQSTLGEWSPDALVRGMPTAADLPRIRLHAQEQRPAPNSSGHDFSADAVEPALLSAVEHALGIDIDFTPLTPESLAHACDAAQRKAHA